MRARGGKVVAIVDEKLHGEHQNHIRMEAVMDRALQHICGEVTSGKIPKGFQ